MNKKTLQHRLLISTALPIAVLSSSPVQARDVVVPTPVAPASSVSGASVNAQIVAATTAPNDANLKVTVPTAAVVTGTSITLIPGQGQGDGKVELVNEGRIGTVDATSGLVTDGAGVVFNGQPQAGAGNTFNGTNSGLIAGGLRAQGFGGSVTLTNAGTVHNGIVATGRGDVAVTTTNAGAVRSGGVIAASDTVSTSSAPAAGMVTNTQTGGKATVIQAGNVADANDDVRGNVSASGLRGADVTVSAKARAVSASAGGVTESVNGANNVVDGAKTTTTFRSDTTLGGGTAKVSIEQGGDVASAFVSGLGGASLTVDGQVEGNGSALSNGFSSTYTTVNVADGVNTSSTVRSVSAAAGKSADVAVGANGSVGGSLTANGQTGATGTVNGVLEGNLTLTSTATNTVIEDASTGSGTGTTFANTTTRTASGGIATGTVGAAGQIGGSVIATGDSGVVLANAGVIEGSVSGNSRRIVTSSTNRNTATATTSPTLAETINQNAATSRSITTKGAAGFTNAAGGQVQGSVSLNAGGDVTHANSGAVFRSTNLSSQGTDTLTTSNGSNRVSTVIAAAPAVNTITTTNESRNTSATTRTGGDVTGTYANSNGTLNFGVNGDGSISQVADKASRATVSGVVYGRLNSQAGSTNFESSSESRSVQVLTGGNGSNTLNTASNSKVTTNASDSNVTVSGKLTGGEAGIDPALYALATGNSVVAISGVVEGNVLSQGFAYDSTNASTLAVTQRITSGVIRTDNLTETGSSGYKAVGGASTVDIAATGKVGAASGDVSSNGLTGASVTVAKGAVVGSAGNAADVYANTGGQDYAYSLERTFVRNAAEGTATGTEKLTTRLTTSGTVGDAAVTVAGNVFGSAESTSQRSKATTTVTGTVGGDARAIASGGFDSQSVTTTDYAGPTPGSASTSFFGLVPRASRSVASATNTVLGGAASVVVDTAADLRNNGKTGVTGSVLAQGVTAATATIAPGSKVGANVDALSNFTNTTRGSTVLYNAAGAADETRSSLIETLAGGDAMVTVGAKSEVGGNVTASGDRTASVSNAGLIGGSIAASALRSVLSETVSSTNSSNVGRREDQTVRAYTGVGGTASVSNTAGGLVTGDVSVAGLTGIIANAGGIGGNVTLGSPVANYRLTQVDTVAGRVQTVAPDTALTIQTYTLDQNNFLGGGVSVTGATSPDPFDREGEPAVRTSNVKATINLNAGSITLGDIVGQRDEQGTRLTDTTLNLTGSGFLGADVLNLRAPTSPTFIAEAVLPKEARDLGFDAGDTRAVRILGVNAVNKTGTGTFVLNLANFDDQASALDLGRWSADVGSINVSGGELQLTGSPYDPTAVDAPYIGIKGNVNVTGGALVIGRRTRVDGGIIGGSIATGGAQTITGVRVAITGDYNQSADGTTVVGISPSLVRFAPVTIGTANGGTEVLGPISASAGVPFFTTPANGTSDQSTPSRIDVSGKVTLAGKVLVNVTRDAIYSSGDGYTLFTYGDAASTVSSVVSPSISSPFVSFELRNNAASKSVQIVARRNGYATVATNPNAVSAANALDALVPTLVQKIRDDAAGGAVFTTVSDIGLVQDAANIVSGLDWRLSQAGAVQVFNELSSAEIYGSLAAIEQNSALTESFETASVTGSGMAGVGLWINPIGRFARYGGTRSGASKIRDNTYGGAFGVNLGYSDDGSLGIGIAYAEHDIAARGTPEKAKAKTYSLGINWRHAFGPIQAAAQFVYGFSNFDVSRQLMVLDRTARASFKGREWDGNVEIGYDVLPDSAISVVPYGKLALRHWTLGGFTEQGAAGIGLTANRASKTVFVPELGVRLATDLVANENVVVRPYGKLSYSFQGNVGSTRAFTFAAGGAPFELRGVDPEGFGSADAGVSALFRDRIGVFVQGGVNFGGSQKGAEVRGGVNVRF